MMERNGLVHDDVISIIFTTSIDLTSPFRHLRARDRLGDIPLLCASEINVPGAMAKCIESCCTPTRPSAWRVRHVYLRNAQSLRDDLPG